MRRRSVGVIVGASTLALAAGVWIVADVLNVFPHTVTVPGVTRTAPQPTIAEQPAPEPMTLASHPNTEVSAAQVAPLWDPVQQAAAEGQWVAWGAVIDALSGETLLDKSGSQAHTPASTTKVLAAFTALNSLNASDTLTTGVKIQGSSLYLWGEGDLLLGRGTGDVSAINGHAGIADLAKRTASVLAQQGISEVDVHWMGNPFAGDSHLDAWATQEVADFEGHVAAMGINSGSFSDNADQFTDTPEADVAAAFVESLIDEGIGAQLGTQTGPPAEATDVASVESATIGQQIRYMLHRSDNTLADQLCRLSAQAQGVESSYVGATNLVRSTLESHGISTRDLVLQDCSGLSSNNKIPALTLARTLKVAHDSASDNGTSEERDTTKAQLSDLIRDLPWAGLQGTMTRRMTEESTEANVQAKTGSLGSVSSLAGVVTTSSGRTLIFAVGYDNVPDGGAYWTRPYLDAFIEGLATL